MIGILRTRIQSEKFLVTWLGAVLNPWYLIRSGLLSAVKSARHHVSGKVLDFGCGSKPYESLFTGATSYTGIDTYSSGHDHKGSRVDVFFDGTKIPFGDSEFDVVVSFEVFEHLFSLDETLKEIWRVLRPGGHLVATVPFAWEETEPPFDFARYTTFGMTHVLERTGFSVVQQSKINNSYLALRQMAIAARAKKVLVTRNTLIRGMLQVLTIAPLTLHALLINFFKKSDYSLYSGQLVVATKVGPKARHA